MRPEEAQLQLRQVPEARDYPRKFYIVAVCSYLQKTLQFTEEMGMFYRGIVTPDV